ncbi:MAG: AAC(3) family N-acetyltransferase [Halodesulfurarchaeum sp.]|nr:AAC(3) family N-acetyltransferase [Halodesulfurarchaeum sp.]
MGEREAIERVDEPVTMAAIAADLRALGVESGDTLFVHTSLSSIGWVSGGAQAVVEALLAAVGPNGTLVMPAHTGQYTDPDDWENPPIPDDWVQTVRDTRPPFDPDRTPSRGVGRVPETFRQHPNAIRSDHPLYSVSALGANADRIAGSHPDDYGLGPESPLGTIYDLDGAVLMLGTTHETNTSLHLAEHIADVEQAEQTRRAPVRRGGERVEIEYRDIELETDDFAAVGADFEADVDPSIGTVSVAESKLFDMRTLVDYATEWFERNR